MNKLNTTSVSLAVTPTVVSTLFAHYFNRKTLKEHPTAHLSYDEGLHLIRSFLDFASHHTIEELQAFTAQWVPHPQWVKVEDVTISEGYLKQAAELLTAQLGADGIRQVGGVNWWQWRLPKSTLQAEWIEMRSDAYERKKAGGNGGRVMMYIHGGAYFFGSVDEHRYQMQRHARKLKARVLAPRYRLAPQFPFPCGLQDCLAAYLYLLTVQDPTTIVLAGDSAGGGMVMSLLCLLRDRGLPLPAGAVLISPWVDLTHSFPSVSGHAPLDYIPQAGFHHKPSRAWPPPNEDDIAMLMDEAQKQKKNKARLEPGSRELKEKQQDAVAEKGDSPQHSSSRSSWMNGGLPTNPGKLLSVTIDGKLVKIKDQIQMYTTNELLAHPLVSPVMQPTLGGLPPLLIMVGGGEILRDEQIYMAHKCANPAKYAPPEESMTDGAKAALRQYKPTDVQLQVWDDLCHVAPTLSFTRPAKYMYRSVAQFGAWALARAQKRGIEIMDDDDISVISRSDSESVESEDVKRDELNKPPSHVGSVGKAGDPLPPFKNHMIRQRVTRHGAVMVLDPESELPGCCMEPSSLGVIKEGTVKKWLAARNHWDQRYVSAKARVHKKILKDMVAGYLEFGSGEYPPPTALAGRRTVDSEMVVGKKHKSLGLAMWSLWGSKHDEMTVEREQKAVENPEVQVATASQGEGARSFAEIEAQDSPPIPDSKSRSRSRRRTVVDENQTESDPLNENTPVAKLLEQRRAKEAAQPDLLRPDHVAETGVVGKRPFIDGIAMPFSLNKEADTASMMTLQSDVTHSRPMSPRIQISTDDGPQTDVVGKRPFIDGTAMPFSLKKEADTASMMTLHSSMSPAPGSRPMSPLSQQGDSVRSVNQESQEGDSKEEEEKEKEEGRAVKETGRPGKETFLTAAEGLPQAKKEAE